MTNRESLLLQAKNELAQALLRCEKMKAMADRNRIVGDLPSDIRIHISESQEPLSHTRNLVDQCVEFPGGLRKLIEALADHNGSSRDFLKVVPIALGAELLRILLDENQLSDKHLSTFFANSRPRLMKPHQASNTWEEIKLLWQMRPLPSERSPILRYVDQIAELSVSNKEELLEWQDWALNRDYLPLQAGETQQKRNSKSQSAPCLTVVVTPLPGASDEIRTAYEVNVHLWREQRSLQLGVSGRVVDLQIDLPSLVIQAIDEAGVYLGESITDLFLEFYLPDELISEEVDRLPRPDDPQFWFGMDYPIVVRPLYRLLDDGPGSGERRSLWLKRWRQVRKRIETDDPAEASILMLASLDDDDHQAVIHLRDYAQLICYLGIPFPLSHAEAIHHPILRLALDRGVPVAMWSRQSSKLTDHHQAHCFVSDMLCDEHSGALPWRLKKSRLDCYAQESHPGNHITLMWDDADRIPPPWNARPLTPPDESEGPE